MAEKKSNKIIASLLALSIVVLVFSIAQLSVKIKRPLHPKGADKNNLLSHQHILDPELDTDGDGISDVDELMIYGTSPYLVDTDGDGISDYDEIFVHGTDPLCPEGETCFMSDYYADMSSNEQIAVNLDQLENLDIDDLDPESQLYLLGLLAQLEERAQIEGLPNESLEPEDVFNPNDFINIDELTLQSVLSGEIDTNTLRLLLLENGMEPATLAKINDQELIEVYREMLSSEQE